MIARTFQCFAVAAALAQVGSAGAAPLPPVPPLDICGAVARVQWLPPLTEPAIRGMSGSAGIDRQWPARLAVVLDNSCTDDPEARALATMFLRGSVGGLDRDLAPDQALLLLPEVAPEAVTLGRTLCVSDFRVSGDEGGTWTRFAALMQLPAALGPASLKRCGR
ncbi:MAG: hypothetical protein K0B00_11590 [Rhodobacteraceae bacterium]|nr:hypothetical protein [Paracoccaceae bacterium]